MKPVLFDQDATTYDTNGIGVLYDAHSCIVYEERNGAFDVTVTYPSDGEYAQEIMEDRIILAKPNDIDEPHAFRIYEVEKDLDSDYIYARGGSITDDLRGNLIPFASVTDATPQMAFDEIKAKLIEPTRFDFVSDIQTRSSSEWSFINPLLAIAGVDGSLVDIWGGDVKRTNNTIYLYSRRGRDHSTVIRPGKNIDGFTMITSTKGVITKVLPIFTYTPTNLTEYEMVEEVEGEGNYVKQSKYSDEYATEEPVTLQGDIVVSPNATKYANNYYTVVDYSNDQELLDVINLYIELRELQAEESETIIDNSNFKEELRLFILDLLNDEAQNYFIYRNPGCDEPNVEMKIDMVQLTDSAEWEKYKVLEHIQITDTVDVYIKKYNLDVEVSIQSITYDSIGGRVTDIVAGSTRNTLSQQTDSVYSNKIKELKQYISTLENGVYNTMTKAANGQVRRFSGYTEPPASVSSKGDLWFKEIGNGKTEMYTYNGVSWVGLITGAEIENMSQLVDNAASIASDAQYKADVILENINNVIWGDGFYDFAELMASKISANDASTLFFQQAEAIGLMYEKNGQIESIIMLNNGTPYIKGENIILDGNTIVDGTFTVTEDMISENAIINSLKANGIDASEIRVINLDFDSMTGSDIELTKGFRITHNGTPVLSVDAVTGQVRIVAPNLATKQDLEEIELLPGPQGPEGPEGPRGIQGPPGTNGTSQYVHIRYSANANGSSMTTSPQSNTAYIGLVNTTSSTAPTGYASYSWSLIKGPQGNQGIEGPAGVNGQTTYTWVKYANDDQGNGLSDTPNGKRYIGLAFNKTTATESTDASLYTWSPLYDNVEVGGVNMMVKSRDTVWANFSYASISYSVGARTDIVRATSTKTATDLDTCGIRQPYSDYLAFLQRGETYTLSFLCRGSFESINYATLRNRSGRYTVISGGNSWAINSETFTKVSMTFVAGNLSNLSPDGVGIMIGHRSSTFVEGQWFEIQEVKLEKGNVATDWTMAPQDIQDQLNEKAETSDLDNLATIVDSIGSQLESAAKQGQLEQLQNEYNARVAQDILDKQKLANDLSTIAGRTALVEILAGKQKLVTEFIETVITESEEGIYIAKGSKKTGILISDNRISFMDNGIEVAYISNQTMEISHGIFVKSATIGDFKFERIPGTTILALTWVGD